MEHDNRYTELDDDLAVCAKVKPSIFRYNMLSKVIVRGLTLASEGRPDFEVWKTDWLTAALQLLVQNPCPNGVGFVERQQLLDGIAPIVRGLQNLMQLQHAADPEMLLDEYDAFYQTFQESVLHGCIKKDKTSSNSVISISYDFLMREEGAYGWAFEPLRIQQMAQHCSGIDSIEIFRQMPIRPNQQDIVEALNAWKSDKLDHRSMALMLSVALEQARTVVHQLEDTGNSKRHLILADSSNFQDMLRPFLGPYYNPFTRTEPIPLDDGTTIDANTYLEELIPLVDRFMAAIVKASNESENAREALDRWKAMLSLYRNRLAQPYQELTREAQEDYYKKVFDFNRSIVACSPAVERVEKGQLSRYHKQEDLLKIYAKDAPNFGRFNSICKLIMSGIDLACEGHPDFDVHKTRWLSAALQLLCENPFTITNELATLHDLSIIKMAFEPLLPRLDTLVSLYQHAHPGDCLPDFLQVVYDIVEENAKDKGDGRKFYYEDSFLFDEDLWGWRFNCRNITRLSQCCPASDAVRYFREAPISSDNGQHIEIVPYTRDTLYADYYIANELMFRESSEILESLISQIDGDASVAQKCSVLDNTSVVIEALKPLNNTYYLPYTKYREAFLKKTQTDLDVPAKCEKYLELANRFITAVCKFAGDGLAARNLKKKFDGLVSSYRLRIKHSDLPLSCLDQRNHLKRITEVLAMFLECNAAVRTGRESEVDPLNDPKVVSILEEIFSFDEQGRLKVVLDGVTKNGESDLRQAMKDKGGRPPKTPKSAKGLTQPQVATIFGVSTDKVSNWERGLTPAPATKDSALVYSKKLREDGDIATLQKIAVEYKKQMRIGAYINSKAKVSYDENISEHNPENP